MNEGASKRSRHIAASLELDCLSGFTDKLEIVGQDLYVKVSFFRGTLAYIDVTLSASKKDEVLTTHAMATLEATKTDNARSMIEMLCRQANELLQSGTWTWETLVHAWSGSRFEPAGVCKFPTFRVMEDLEEWGGIVSSPLDAVAKLIQKRMPSWLAKMPKEEVEDGKHEGKTEEA